MRLIQGAEASDLYSLESIIEEFSDAPKAETAAEKAEEQTIEQPQEQEAPPKEAAQAEETPAEVQTEKLAESTVEPVEHGEEALPIDEDQPPPVYENLSESQMADAIVFAVLIVVLLVRPAGLFGKNIQEKV